jgi:hypothetical protein
VFSESLQLSDARLLAVSLEGLKNVFAMGDSSYPKKKNPYVELFDEEAIERLESLQTHSSTDVYNLTIELLQKYFDEQEEEEQQPAPSDVITFIPEDEPIKEE